MTSLSKDYKTESDNLNEKISQNHIKIKNQYDEIQSLRSEYTKDIALKNQEIEFNLTKINELQKYINDSILKNEEKIKLIRETLETEFSERINNLNKEKIDIEAKLNQKRKEMKDIEMNLNKEISMLEKEKSVLLEKLISLNKHRDELAEALEKEREISENKIQEMKNENKREIEMSLKENETIRNKLKKLEIDYSELTANYEKDNDLWTTKFRFLEEQRNQARLDLAECQKKFENQLDSFSKRGVQEKDKFESIKNTVIGAIEQKYKNHIKELQENFNAKIEEVNTKRKNVEEKNKILTDQLNEKSQSSNSNMNELEKKLILFKENEIKLKDEISSLIMDKEKKIKELNDIKEADRNNFNDKLVELENKLRENETKRVTHNLQCTKEKATYEKEKQSMKSKI
jgi:chromosome segregation ATPase